MFFIRYRNKSFAYEKVIEYSVHEKLKLSGSISNIYINATNELTTQVTSLTDALIEEKSKSKKLEIELKKLIENQVYNFILFIIRFINNYLLENKTR